MSVKLTPRKKIQLRIRKSIKGTAEKPRLTVFRSNKAIYCQLVDDLSGQTLASASSKGMAAGTAKSDIAKQVGTMIAEKAKDLNISNVVFDRAGYIYHGRIKALADGAREAGLNF